MNNRRRPSNDELAAARLKELEQLNSTKKIGRNDPCWCGSGRKYKRCHLDREAEGEVPFRGIRSEVLHIAKERLCLHPDASAEACGKVISAHTLQRSRAIKAIADDTNHVLTLVPYDRHGSRLLMKVQRRGWRDASTFSAFCERHDSLAFAPLETCPFSGSKEQIFLIGYRAICWELYQKLRFQKTESTRRNLLDRGATKHAQRIIQKNLMVEHAIIDRTINELTRIKRDMDNALVTKDWSQYETWEVQMQGPLSVAATGAISPNLLNIKTKAEAVQKVFAPLQELAFGVDLTEDGRRSVVFLWSAVDPAPKRYMSEINDFTDRELAEFLVQFFFAHCENTYFSSAWWHSLPDSDRQFLSILMANDKPYYNNPQYELRSKIAPWRIISKNFR